jgi:hypothetical protein
VTTAFPLHLAFVLVAIHPDGRPALPGQTIDVALAGAVLSDLATTGHVELRDGRVTSTGGPPPDHPVLARVAGAVAADPRERTATWWVRRIGGRALRDEVLATAVDRGLLREEPTRVLGLFPSTRFPEAHPGIRQRVVDELALVVREQVAPDPSSAGLVALCSATGMLRREFGRLDRAVLRRITEGDWASPAVARIIAETSSMMMAVAVVGATASGGGDS